MHRSHTHQLVMHKHEKGYACAAKKKLPRPNSALATICGSLCTRLGVQTGIAPCIRPLIAMYRVGMHTACLLITHMHHG